MKTLRRFTTPDRFDGGPALIVTDSTAMHRNGTELTGIERRDGLWVAIVEGRLDGSHRVEWCIYAWDGPPPSGGDRYRIISTPRLDAK